MVSVFGMIKPPFPETSVNDPPALHAKPQAGSRRGRSEGCARQRELLGAAEVCHYSSVPGTKIRDNDSGGLRSDRNTRWLRAADQTYLWEHAICLNRSARPATPWTMTAASSW